MPATPLAISALAASLVLAVFSAARAQNVGFAEIVGGVISPAVNYNSAGRANSVAVAGTGVYVITFPGFHGLNSDVQVNAIRTDDHRHYCTSVYWNGNVQARVACFDRSGKPSAADFSILYQSRTTAPTIGSIAFLWANNPTASSYVPVREYSFNATGGVNRVRRNAPGSYTAFLPGLFPRGNPQVTAYGPAASRCQVENWVRYPRGTKVDVLCVNAAGTPADELFDLSYAERTTAAAGPAATAFGAYAYADKPTNDRYGPAKPRQFNSLSAERLAAYRYGGADRGHYALVAPKQPAVTFQAILGMVTAVGSAGEYCEQAGVTPNAGSLEMQLFCYTATGDRTNTGYSGMFVTAQ